MARTVTEYEPSDIDLKNDDLHKELFGAVLGAMLLGTVKPKENEDPMLPMRRGIAFLLTALERAGYSITKRESVPDVFKAFSVDSAPPIED